MAFLILCLASIGLISQVFHTGGKFYQALLFWSFIAFSVAFSARQMFVPFMWTMGFLGSMVFAALDLNFLVPVFKQNYEAVFMTIPLLCVGFTALSNRFFKESEAPRAFRAWTLIGGLIALAVADYYEVLRDKILHDFLPYVPGYCLAMWSAYATWKNAEYRWIQKILFLVSLMFYLIPFYLLLYEVQSPVVYATFTIVTLGLVSLFLASMKERRWFQWFIIPYFQTLGGLATNGLGLIVSSFF